MGRYGALLFLVTTVHCYSGDRYIDYSSDDETAGEDLTHLPEQQQLFGYNINQRRSGQYIHRTSGSCTSTMGFTAIYSDKATCMLAYRAVYGGNPKHNVVNGVSGLCVTNGAGHGSIDLHVRTDVSCGTNIDQWSGCLCKWSGCPGGYHSNGYSCQLTTVTPTNAPTNAPSKAPTNAPTNAPSTAPTAAPTVPPWWTCFTEGSNLPWSHNEIDTNLKSISINMGILVPRFDPGTHEYTVLFEAGTNHTGELLLWANLSSPCAYLNGSGYLNPAVPSPQVLKNYGPVWPTGPFQTRGLYRVVFDQERDTIFQVRVVDDRALPSGNASYTSYSIKIPAAAGADGLAVPVLPPGHSCQDRPSLGRTMQPGGMLDAGLGGWQSYVTREGRGRQGLEVHDDVFCTDRIE